MVFRPSILGVLFLIFGDLPQTILNIHIHIANSPIQHASIHTFIQIATMPAETIPRATKEWRVEGQKGFDCLQLNEDAPIPELGDTECLVRWHCVSLNYRDLLVTKVCYQSPALIILHLSGTKRSALPRANISLAAKIMSSRAPMAQARSLPSVPKSPASNRATGS